MAHFSYHCDVLISDVTKLENHLYIPRKDLLTERDDITTKRESHTRGKLSHVYLGKALSRKAVFVPNSNLIP